MRPRSTRTWGSPAGIWTRTSRPQSESLHWANAAWTTSSIGQAFNAEFDFAGIEAGHFAGFADEAVQAVGFFIDDGQHFVALAIGECLSSRANW